MAEGRRVRVGVQVAPALGDFADVRRAALAAEELGADVLFGWDHFFPLGRAEERAGKHFEGWMTLASWAEATSRVELGMLVSCVAYRNPDLLADMARTVDHISGGRVVLGLGAGFRRFEYEAYGYEFGTAGERVAQLAEAARRVRGRLRVLNPPADVPLLLAANGPKALRVVAEHADRWHTFAAGDELTRASRVVDDRCAEVGRDPAEIERSAFVRGDPSEVGPDYLARGVTTFVVLVEGPDFGMAEVRRWLGWRDRVNGGAGG
ncbi:LLM class F420-dependent oxidoreductase [Actinoplanes sp. NPDC051470]|uniref:LLM class F420-dependent oxidoreductase n=1 Tax=Actinoplanes sp. NPDC051470 TaxID=3157224 RepID=UPI003412D08B